MRWSQGPAAGAGRRCRGSERGCADGKRVAAVGGLGRDALVRSGPCDSAVLQGQARLKVVARRPCPAVTISNVRVRDVVPDEYQQERMMSFTEADVQNALKELIDPNTKKDFVSGKSIKNVKVSGNDVTLEVQLGYPAKSVWDEIGAMVEGHLKPALPGVGKVSASVSSKVVPHAVQRGV